MTDVMPGTRTLSASLIAGADTRGSTEMVDGDTWVKTDSYVRTAMVALLIGLGTAVIYQSVTQGFLLDSVSAYYYTPAQGMFVGSLIGRSARRNVGHAASVVTRTRTGVPEDHRRRSADRRRPRPCPPNARRTRRGASA